MEFRTARLSDVEDLVKLEKEYNDNLETFMKKREKLTSAKIKVLLFDKILNKIQIDKQGMQSITTFFTQRN